MKILASYIAASTQIHTGKCYFLGLVSEGGKTVKAYNVETSGSIAAANQVGYIHEDNSAGNILPKPGVECTNGLYVVVDSGDCMVYYSLG